MFAGGHLGGGGAADLSLPCWEDETDRHICSFSLKMAAEVRNRRLSVFKVEQNQKLLLLDDPTATRLRRPLPLGHERVCSLLTEDRPHL